MARYRVVVDPLPDHELEIKQQALIEVDYDRGMVSLVFLAKLPDMVFWAVLPEGEVDQNLKLLGEEIRDCLEATIQN